MALRDDLKSITIGADSAMLIATGSASSMRITLRALANHTPMLRRMHAQTVDDDDEFAKIPVGLSDAHA